ncbi:hypothetical protein G7067_10380 [Leucobacter insecticola]|uniref:Uncharacterized protein n=1 Tax=Leucobacter insecticola TaxID=2714934 RepID=A0A6G8FJU8_9MICO|nr:hypothetical protein [Leucobacter insecticola]QIM16716.1 hypothetical protein G7067_10380 [Leucobacter insecticola]
MTCPDRDRGPRQRTIWPRSSAAALFVTFLARNGILRNDADLPRITNNTLAAITLTAHPEPQ